MLWTANVVLHIKIVGGAYHPPPSPPLAYDRFSYLLETGEFVGRGGGADTVGATNYLKLQRSNWLHGKFHENVACIA